MTPANINENAANSPEATLHAVLGALDTTVPASSILGVGEHVAQLLSLSYSASDTRLKCWFRIIFSKYFSFIQMVLFPKQLHIVDAHS